MSRCAGVLNHITSLPSPGPIGDLGREAYSFVDFLVESGVSIWQVLPLCPTGSGDSPYQSPSAFAGNPLLISPAMLREEGLLSYRDDEIPQPARADETDYAAADACKTALLRRSFEQHRRALEGELSRFRKRERWVEDYALFMALRKRFGGARWTDWPDRDLRFRRLFAMRRARAELKEEIQFHIFCQYLFRKQWAALKAYANERGVRMMGDMPIYVSADSADAWAHPRVFQLDRNRRPRKVAGVPPDLFSEDGQLWGNPVYNWRWLRLTRYSWWVSRMRAMESLFDVLRVDHFIGFANYYSIPAGATTAREGEWIPAPGDKLFHRLEHTAPNLEIVAEDLGVVSDRVRELLKETGFPGMRVMAFGFDGGDDNPHRLANFVDNAVAYTGTHDNDTIMGMVEKASPETLAAMKEALGFDDPADAPRAFIRALMRSPAETAIVPLQDLLGLGGEARMNTPGTPEGNWRWRCLPGALTPDLAQRFHALLKETGRLVEKEG